MADPDPNATDPQTTGAVPAPGADEGQAGGSPPLGETPTSDSNGQSEKEKELRRKVTSQSEELAEYKKAARILEVAMSKPGWKTVEAEIMGKTVDPAEDLDAQVFAGGERTAEEAIALGKKWKDSILREAEERALKRLQPMTREVMESKEQKALERALVAQGLPAATIDSEAFQTFRNDFAADNEGFEKYARENPGPANKWLVSDYARKNLRGTREPVGDRENATLERGGGAPSRVGSAASQVKIDRADPNKIHKLHEAITKGETPVDQNGVPYKIPGR